MGMSASQARLLSITSRLSDNELRSQTITTAKMSLSNRTTEASAAYMDALSQTKLLYTTYDASGNKILESLTGASLSQYGELKNQYGLINSSNQILVSELDVTNYENSANMYEFLDKYGVLSEPGKGDFVQVVNPDWEVAWGEYNKEYEEWKTKEPDKNDQKYKLPESSGANLYNRFMDSVTKAGCWMGENPYPSHRGSVYHIPHILTHMLEYDVDYTAYPGEAEEITFHKPVLDNGTWGTVDGQYGWNNESESIMKEVRERMAEGEIVDKDPTLIQDIINTLYDAVQRNIEVGDGDSTATTYYPSNGFPTKTDEELAERMQDIIDRLKQAFSEPGIDEDLYNKDREDWLAQEPEKPDVPYYVEKEQRKIVNKDKGQWYVNLWHRMNGPSQTKAGTTDESGNVVEGGTTENGLPKYKVLEDGLMNSADWLQYALGKGTVTLERVDFTDPTEEGTGLSDCTWTSIIWTNAQDITEEQNEAAITKAEVEYEQALRDIEAKDKQYDNQLKLLDSEHNALQTEYDSVKGVIEKNIERTLKIYS